MKLESIIMTLTTKGSPWNTMIRNHLSWKNSKHRPQLERSCWLFFRILNVWFLQTFLKKKQQ